MTVQRDLLGGLVSHLLRQWVLNWKFILFSGLGWIQHYCVPKNLKVIYLPKIKFVNLVMRFYLKGSNYQLMHF